MQLEYLVFDASDEEAGSCSFDAMASVQPARLPALLHEVGAVLGWACRHFGAPSAGEAGEAGEWDFELQAVGEQDAPLEIAYEVGPGRIAMPQVQGRVTLALTIAGSAAFAQAFRTTFSAAD